MAKRAGRNGGANKSQAIRDQLKKSPDATAVEIAAAAGKQVGAEVSPGLVYQIKARLAGPKRKRRKRRAAPRAAVGGMNAALIREAAAFLNHAGNSKAAREALSVAEEVSKALSR